MSYFGGYFGFAGSGGGGEEEPPELTPIPVPIVFGDPEYHDFARIALNRLCQQFKSQPEID